MLRDRLNSISNNSMFHDTYVRGIERLRESTGHTIQVLSSANDDLEYNCVAYALGLAKHKEYKGLIGQCTEEELHPNTEFVESLIDNGEMIEQLAWQAGLLGVYYQEGVIKHIGLFVSDSRLRSKWSGGPLLEHAALEVPQDYGGCVRAFSAPSQDAVLNHFVLFANSKGQQIRRDG